MPVFKTVSPAALDAALKEVSGRYALNNTGSTIAAFAPVSWYTDGSLELASATNVTADTFAGLMSVATPTASYGIVLHGGRLPGAAVGLGAVPGQPVFLSETAGQLTLSTTGFQSGSAIIRVGFAEPADHATGTATDLTIDIALISQP